VKLSKIAVPVKIIRRRRAKKRPTDGDFPIGAGPVLARRALPLVARLLQAVYGWIAPGRSGKIFSKLGRARGEEQFPARLRGPRNPRLPPRSGRRCWPPPDPRGSTRSDSATEPTDPPTSPSRNDPHAAPTSDSPSANSPPSSARKPFLAHWSSPARRSHSKG